MARVRLLASWLLIVWRRRVRRWLVHPAATALLIVALWIDAERLPSASVVGEFMDRPRRPNRQAFTMVRSMPICWLAPDGEAFRPVPMWTDPPPDERWMAGEVVWYQHRRFVWARTGESEGSYFAVWPPGHRLSAERVELARRVCIDFLRAGPGERPVEWVEMIPPGGTESRRLLWAGYLHNAAALMGFVLLAVSLGWVPGAIGKAARWWAAHRVPRDRRSELIRRGLCPRCRYDVRGLPCKQCPECGEKWSHDEAAGWV